MMITASASAGPAEDKSLLEASGCGSARGVDLERMKAALKSGANPNAHSSTARVLTPLECVTLTLAGQRDAYGAGPAVEAAKLLFNAGAKLGGTTLFFPIASGSVEMVRLLIDKGASPTAKDEGFTPTELARKYGQTAVYEYLVSRGGVPVDSSVAALLLLIEAANDANIATMERAIREGARVDSVGPNGRTALIEVLRNPAYTLGRADAIKWLLAHGADPNRKAESGFRGIEGLPLHVFISMTSRTFNERERDGSPNRWLPGAEEVLAALLGAGAKVSGMDSLERTPLHVAAKSDNVRVAEVLLKEGAKVMPKDAAGKTPLDYAESAPMIKLLKANGAMER